MVIFAAAPWSEEIAGVAREAFALSVPTAYLGAPDSLKLVTSVPPIDPRSSGSLVRSQ